MGNRDRGVQIQSLCSCGISPEAVTRHKFEENVGAGESDFWGMGRGGLVAVTS